MDRDVLAVMNLSIKGLARFASPEGLAGEAMKGNVEKEPLILSRCKQVEFSKEGLTELKLYDGLLITVL
jgi:hypothetical protein